MESRSTRTRTRNTVGEIGRIRARYSSIKQSAMYESGIQSIGTGLAGLAYGMVRYADAVPYSSSE